MEIETCEFDVVVSKGIGYNNQSPMSATKCIYISHPTLGKIENYRSDGLLALVKTVDYGRMWFFTHNLESIESNNNVHW
jgi:hypothetical protein